MFSTTSNSTEFLVALNVVASRSSFLWSGRGINWPHWTDVREGWLCPDSPVGGEGLDLLELAPIKERLALA